MALFDKFKKKKSEPKELSVPPLKSEVKEPIKKAEIKKEPAKKRESRGRKIAYEILVRPLVTEKASGLAVINQYVFAVQPKANKVEIKKAIEELYGVSPIAVNIIKMRGKHVRYGRTQGRTKNWKKAVITLKKGESIKIYEV